MTRNKGSLNIDLLHLNICFWSEVCSRCWGYIVYRVDKSSALRTCILLGAVEGVVCRRQGRDRDSPSPGEMAACLIAVMSLCVQDLQLVKCLFGNHCGQASKIVHLDSWVRCCVHIQVRAQPPPHGGRKPRCRALSFYGAALVRTGDFKGGKCAETP